MQKYCKLLCEVVAERGGPAHCNVCRRFLGWEHHKEGAGGGAVRLHTNIIHPLFVADAGIHPISCSRPYPMSGPYTCRSLTHGPFWKQQQEQGFATAFPEHSEEHSMVFPFLTGGGYV